MQTVQVNDADLAYEVIGTGSPIIFVHGFLASSTGEYYAAIKQRFAEQYRVYCVDMRSHGGSAAVTANVGLDQCGRDIIGFAHALDLDGVPLVGHSMGGYLAMVAALHDPRRFSRLCLITPAGSKGAPRNDDAIAAFMAARKDPGLMDQRFRAMFTRPPRAETLTVYRRSALMMPDAVAQHWMQHEWPASDITEQLSALDLPVLSLIGAKDVIVPPQQEYADALRMPRAKIVTFTDEGHMLPIEHPDRCFAEIKAFIAE